MWFKARSSLEFSSRNTTLTKVDGEEKNMLIDECSKSFKNTPVFSSSYENLMCSPDSPSEELMFFYVTGCSVNTA